MQLALLAFLPQIGPQDDRFWTQLDANRTNYERTGRGLSTEGRRFSQVVANFRIADKPGVDTGRQNAVMLNHFARLAEALRIFYFPNSLTGV